MATEVHKQEFRIRDLPTRSVILFPSQAQIIRDIASITLKPGANKIVITGISPTVDENSIKVEGTGAATITEVSHDLLPNREIYEEVYPSDDEDEDETSLSDESDEEIDEMKELNVKIKEAQNKLASHQESINSGTNRLQICDNFGQSVRDARPLPEDLKNLLGTYENERFQIFQEHQEHTNAIEDIQEDITKLEKQKTKLAKALVKANEKKEKEKVKLEQQRLRKKAEIAKEKARIKAERESFWPKKVYNITISIELACKYRVTVVTILRANRITAALTPALSRRSSIDGDTIVNLATTDFHKPGKEELKDDEISLSLSYITFSASWSPRYDLALNTVKSIGSLDYGAELRNTTSETWKDCKVILSTSQTSFSGLSETIPVLQPWHVRLQKGKNHDSALYSRKELNAKRAEHSRSTGTASQKPRGEIFGREGSSAPVVKVGLFSKPTLFGNTDSCEYNRDSRNRQVQHVLNQNSAPVQNSLFGANSSAIPPPPMAASAFGAPRYEAARGGGLFGSSVMNARRSAPGGRAEEHEEEEKIDYSDEDMGFGLFDGDTPSATKPLVFEEGAWEESGMTTVSFTICYTVTMGILTTCRPTTSLVLALLHHQTQRSSTRLQRSTSAMSFSLTSSSANFDKLHSSKLASAIRQRSPCSKDLSDLHSTDLSSVKRLSLVSHLASLSRCLLVSIQLSMSHIQKQLYKDHSPAFSVRRTAMSLLVH